VYPDTQSQTKIFSILFVIHCPPFLQGLGEHGVDDRFVVIILEELIQFP
jgi:hypothetical protein